MTTNQPTDVPAARPACLDQLDMLVGRWDMTASFAAGYFGPDSPAVTAGGGRTTFEWLDGRYFLIQRVVNDHPEVPNVLAVIGAATEHTLSQHYYDSRGIERVYQMTLTSGMWQLWRAAPGFWQRYAGIVSAGGDTITGAWEMSPDGTDWKHDFDLNYTKVT